MSYFKYKNKDIFYRVIGKGKPLLLLNGIMMSTKSWKAYEDELSKNNQLILLDLLDQGQSSKADGEYNQTIQVAIVKELLDVLKIDKVSIMGTSYGGSVALQFAIAYQDYIERMVLFNTVAKTNAWLREIGDAWNHASGNPEAYYATTIPVIYSPAFYDRKAQWMEKRKKELTTTSFASKDFIDSMIRLTNSARDYDVCASLREIKVPTLIIGSEQDHITPLEEQRYLAKEMVNAQLIILPDTGHASFYERPVIFTTILNGFINLDKLEYII